MTTTATSLATCTITGASTPTITADTSAVANPLHPGDTFTVPVKIANNPGFATYVLEAVYDANALTLTDITNGDMTPALTMTNTSAKKVQYTGATDITTASGTLFNLVFSVNTGAAADDYSIAVKYANDDEDNFCNAATSNVAVTFTAGEVTVAAAPTLAAGYNVLLSADKSEVQQGGTVAVSLDIQSGSTPAQTTYNTVDMALTFDSAKFSFSADDSTLPAGVTATADGGTITLRGHGANKNLADGAEIVLSFTAGNAGTAAFTLTGAKVDAADHAFTDATAATVSGSPKSVTVNAVITPPAPEKFTVTYDPNGATSGTIPTDGNQYDSGATVTVLGNTGNLTIDGKDFDGWNTQANGQGTPYAADATFAITADTTLYAQWKDSAVTPTNPTVSIVEISTTYLDGYTLIKATIENANGNVPTYNGEAMYLIGNDTTNYYYIVKTADYAETNVGYGAKTAEVITRGGDANGSGNIDINDAQFIYNLYNTGMNVTYVPTAKQLLAADLSGNGSIGSEDCAAAVAAIA